MTSIEERDRELVQVKLPKWMKQLAGQIGEVTGEELGEVFERVAGDSLVRDHGHKQQELARCVPGVEVHELGGEGG